MKIADDKARRAWNDGRWHTVHFSSGAESKLVIHQKDVDL